MTYRSLTDVLKMWHSSDIWERQNIYQNFIQEEFRRRSNSDNACYYSMQTLLSSRLLCRNIKIRIYKTIILPAVLNGCETWPLTLRKEDRLRVFENRVLRRIFGPKRDEVAGGWRKLHNEELHNSYSSPSTVSSSGEETGLAVYSRRNVSPRLLCPPPLTRVQLFADSLMSVSLHAHIYKNTVKR
jgi:hypothetical protein